MARATWDELKNEILALKPSETIMVATTDHGTLITTVSRYRSDDGVDFLINCQVRFPESEDDKVLTNMQISNIKHVMAFLKGLCVQENPPAGDMFEPIVYNKVRRE